VTRSFRRFDARTPVIVGFSVFLLSLISSQRSPLAGDIGSCWRTCEEEPLVSSWGVVAVAAACGLAAGVARYDRRPVYLLSALGWLAYSMWAAVVVASYYAGLKSRHWGAVWYLTFSPLVMVAAVLWPSARHGGPWRGPIVYLVTVIGMLIVLPFMYGRWVRGRREQQVELEEFRGAQAREVERSRIAREMHDVVAHRVSLMVLHAGALEMGARDERTVYTAGLIRAAGREALKELRQVLGVLRGPAGTEPLPGIGDIPRLVELTREAGLPVDLALNMPVPHGTSAVQRTAYRIVQEALTNVVKYAPGAQTWVTLSCTAKTLYVDVRNDSATGRRDPIPSSGLGLIGLSERVKVLDGKFTAGALHDGGFAVRAEIPLKGSDDDSSAGS
jgi:signal transduction histidine kinase